MAIKKNTGNADALLILALGMSGVSSEKIITDQEKAGKREVVNSSMLPVDFQKPYDCPDIQTVQDAWTTLTEIGIILKEDPKEAEKRGELFVEVSLPEGWHIKPTDHSMWTKLVDDKGFERAAIFYKAAFYDRSAHFSMSTRIHFRNEPILGYDNPNYNRDDRTYLYRVTCEEAGGTEPTVLWQSETYQDDYVPNWQLDKMAAAGTPIPNDVRTYDQVHAEKKVREEEGKAFLARHFPDYRDFRAYWDLDTVEFLATVGQTPSPAQEDGGVE